MFEGDGVVTKDFEGSEKILRREQEAARNLRAHTRGTRGLARSSDRVVRLPTWDRKYRAIGIKELELVTQIFSSWNRIVLLLRHVDEAQACRLKRTHSFVVPSPSR
jgi:hypothetical protein